MNLKLTILGCGGSAGVPAIGNRWGTCDPNNPKNRRTRCSLMVQSASTTFVVDTGPEFREQLNRVAVDHLDAVLFTHWHSDHVNGFEDIRYLYKKDRGLIPLYADIGTQKLLEEKFPHMFDKTDTTGFYPVPVEFKGWQEQDFYNMQTIGEVPVKPFKMVHSITTAVGYRFGDAAYCTDVSEMPAESANALKGVKTLIIDCNNMLYEETFVHMNFKCVQNLNKIVQAQDVVLTHLKNNSDYDAVSAQLPDGYRLAYDGLQIEASA